MTDFRKLSSEAALQALAFPPCRIEFLPNETGRELRGRPIGDGVLRISWRKYQERFVYVFRTAEGPRALQETAGIAQLASRNGLLPLVIAPHLTEDALDALEELGISGLDLCGNGLLLDPPRLMMRRTGAKGPSRPPPASRNVYQGVSSLVARLLLTRSSFQSPAAVWTECRLRLPRATERSGGVLTKSTISKALTQMEADLFITRESARGAITLVRPASLLERLERSYVAPLVKNRVSGKPKDAKNFWSHLRERADVHGLNLAISGLGSARYHTAMANSACLPVYVSELAPVIESDILTPTTAFPSVELIETSDVRVYFDTRDDGTMRWASPLQTYLELVNGGPRERGTALELQRALLRPLEANP